MTTREACVGQKCREEAHARGPRPDGGIAVGTLISFNGEIGGGVPSRSAAPCDPCNMQTVRMPRPGAGPGQEGQDVALAPGTP